MDLVLVTVPVYQADVLLPALSGSAAKTVMFMFNTVRSLDRLRAAVGAERFAFGYPAIAASLNDGRLSSSILSRGMTTTVTDPLWAKVFGDAGVPSTVQADMESWLRTHAAVIVPLAIAAGIAYQRGSGVSKPDVRRCRRGASCGHSRRSPRRTATRWSAPDRLRGHAPRFTGPDALAI